MGLSVLHQSRSYDAFLRSVYTTNSESCIYKTSHKTLYYDYVILIRPLEREKEREIVREKKEKKRYSERERKKERERKREREKERVERER